MAINWGDNSALAGFQNALALGADIGGAIRQRREDNALGAYMDASRGSSDPSQMGTLVATPEQKAASEDAYRRLNKINPRLAMQAQGQIASQQAAQAKLLQEQQAVQLRQQAAQGDPVALQKLVGIDFDSWKTLDGNKRKMIEDQTAYTGQAALRISQLPPAQQAAAWDAAIDQGVQAGYTGLADFKGKFSPNALRGAIDNAGLVEKFISLAEPKYQVIPEKGTLVDTRDPGAVAAFTAGQPAQATIPQGAADHLRQNPSLKDAFDAKYGAGAADRVLGGGSSNATGGFR